MDIKKINLEKERLAIQLHTNELIEIAKTIKPPINFLVFGVGNDSVFWYHLNKGGRTIFIEDDKKWFDLVKKRYPFLEVYFVEYGTKREEWREYISSPKRLLLSLPQEILTIAWDVILVDGPAGYADGTPGRMKSIYTATKLIKNGGHLFIHDAEREVEKSCCSAFLSRVELVRSVQGRATLNHYKFQDN